MPKRLTFSTPQISQWLADSKPWKRLSSWSVCWTISLRRFWWTLSERLVNVLSNQPIVWWSGNLEEYLPLCICWLEPIKRYLWTSQKPLERAPLNRTTWREQRDGLKLSGWRLCHGWLYQQRFVCFWVFRSKALNPSIGFFPKSFSMVWIRDFFTDRAIHALYLRRATFLMACFEFISSHFCSC